eukprot:Seg2652.1 transcript_id=Seg2652.1/GoldUCD/mRNA.D3Y31 product="Protease Do-like 10 mitochondrial" protein_id=Seg2652.1/GoldUCD/D3Y31
MVQQWRESKNRILRPSERKGSEVKMPQYNNGERSTIKTNEQILQSVVKLFVQYATPNYCMPWQMKRQQQAFGSGFVIEGKRILTNAHVIKYHKSIRVRKHGDAKKYQADVLYVAHECDIAMVGVEDDKFWEDLNHLEFGDIPRLEQDVVVVGFPTGGDNISVTRGVVSRVDIRRYSHSGQDLLAIQIDAAINAGNSGGPALQDGKVVGIAFQALGVAENIGYIIPVSVIDHFLDDIKQHQVFSGFCVLGVKWQPIEAEQMRSYFKLAPDDTGVLVANILKLSCGHDIVKKGDILMSIDGCEIADNGTVLFRGDERIYWNYLLHSKFPGEAVKALILRSGKKVQIEIKLDTYRHLVPRHLYEKTPSYVVYCGLVFVVLSQPYMQHQFGKDWATKSPVRLCERVHTPGERIEQEVVLLSQVLASELTAGYEAFSNLQLYRVNGIPVLNLRHLCYLLDQFTRPHLNDKNTSAANIRKVAALDSNLGQNPELQNAASQDNEGTKDQGDPMEAQGKAENEAGSVVASLSGSNKKLHVTVSSEPAVKKSRIDSKNENPSVVSQQISKHQTKSDAMTCFGDIENYYASEPVHDQMASPGNDVTNDKIYSAYNDADIELYKEFTRDSPNLYTKLLDESLLLDCDNFVNFELDKDRIIVLNIKDAKEKSNSILEQHAITNPRSKDMPACLF